jgi:hypothetical protein
MLPFVSHASFIPELTLPEPLRVPVRIEYDTQTVGGTAGDLSAYWLKDPADYASGRLKHGAPAAFPPQLACARMSFALLRLPGAAITVQ